MAVTALSTPPTPQNSNGNRGMFAWLGQSNYLDTDNHQQSLINFCGSNGVNTLFMDFYSYLGAGNWSSANVTRVKQFISVAHASGIRVMALCGNTDWGTNQQWVLTNIIRRLADFDLISDTGTTNNNDGFDGIMLDVEYWTVGGYDATVQVPALCALVKAVRRMTGGKPVGLFTTQWLTTVGTAQSVTYGGVTQLEGYHLMYVADFTVVACYSNNGAGTDGATQISEFQPWYDYAKDQTRNYGLYCGSETGAGQPAGTSYNGETKAKMEQNHSAISTQFAVATDAVFLGQAIDSYASYSGMS
jgi:hypothetical protein